jgi:hypothetical protein
MTRPNNSRPLLVELGVLPVTLDLTHTLTATHHRDRHHRLDRRPFHFPTTSYYAAVLAGDASDASGLNYPETLLFRTIEVARD